MGLKTQLANLKNRLYDFLSNPKTVKTSTIAAMLVMLPAFIIGYFVAQFDPDGYNIIDNYISDMGSFNHTPLPYFLDYGAMITAFLLIPAAFYLDKTFAPFSRDSNTPQKSSRLRLRLASYALLSMGIALIGLFGIGLFSEDRSKMLEPLGVSIGLHGPFSYVVFGGLVLAGIFSGFLVLIYRTKIPKLLGLYMIIIPPIMSFLFLIDAPPSLPFYEWLLLFSILGWLIPAGTMIIKDTNKELISR